MMSAFLKVVKLHLNEPSQKNIYFSTSRNESPLLKKITSILSHISIYSFHFFMLQKLTNLTCRQLLLDSFPDSPGVTFIIA